MDAKKVCDFLAMNSKLPIHFHEFINALIPNVNVIVTYQYEKSMA